MFLIVCNGVVLCGGVNGDISPIWQINKVCSEMEKHQDKKLMFTYTQDMGEDMCVWSEGLYAHGLAHVNENRVKDNIEIDGSSLQRKVCAMMFFIEPI